MISVEEMKKFLGSDEQFIAGLMEKFLEESGRDMEKMKAACAQKNWEQVRALSHKILSSTRIFNLEEMNMLLEEIEIAAEEKRDTEHIPAMVDKAGEAWAKTQDEVQEMRSKIKAP